MNEEQTKRAYDDCEIQLRAPKLSADLRSLLLEQDVTHQDSEAMLRDYFQAIGCRARKNLEAVVIAREAPDAADAFAFSFGGRRYGKSARQAALARSFETGAFDLAPQQLAVKQAVEEGWFWRDIAEQPIPGVQVMEYAAPACFTTPAPMTEADRARNEQSRRLTTVRRLP